MSIPIVEILHSLIVLTKTSHIFGIFGIPQVLRSANGSPFTSKEFKQFFEYKGIRAVTPEWPGANEMV